MKNLNIRDAIGTREGDYLLISNKFARVYLTRENDGVRHVWTLGGDASGTYNRLEEAMNVALHELALYERGRAD